MLLASTNRALIGEHTRHTWFAQTSHIDPFSRVRRPSNPASYQPITCASSTNIFSPPCIRPLLTCYILAMPHGDAPCPQEVNELETLLGLLLAQTLHDKRATPQAPQTLVSRMHGQANPNSPAEQNDLVTSQTGRCDAGDQASSETAGIISDHKRERSWDRSHLVRHERAAHDGG